MERKTTDGGLRLSIFDPSGNITALVESPVGIDGQRAAAARIGERFPFVEQVGFVRLPPEDDGLVELRMAGGEFCGNASMSAAALLLLRRGANGEKKVRLRVSGVSHEVEVRLRRADDGVFDATVRMPRALSVTEEDLALGALRGRLPVARMEGISHAIVTPGSPFFRLTEDREGAEAAARQLCAALGAEALGLLFLAGEPPRLRLTPLVFVPGSATLCWESSCASGSAAVGTVFAEREGAPVRLELSSRGGVLIAESEGLRGGTYLTGRTRLLREEIG